MKETILSNCIILSGGTWNPEDRCIIYRSLGPYRISAALEDAGYTTFVLDYINKFTIEEILEVLKQHVGEDTLWVGFSSTFFWQQNRPNQSFNDRVTDSRGNNNVEDMYYTGEYSEVEQIFDFVRKNSKAKLIFGGARTPWFIKDHNIDYYVLGYADNSTVELTNYIAGKQANPNLVEHLSKPQTSLYDRVIDSTKFPEPDVKNIPTRWWKHKILPNEALPIELGRGCIFKCKFCSYALTGKKKGTYVRDLQQVRDELIQTWETHGTDTYSFTDDTFNDDNEKLEILHNLFTSLPFKPKFSCYLRIDLINKFPHQADLLTEMGLIGNFFGLETMHPESAKAIGKGLHPNKIKDRLYWLREKWKNKVNMEAGFILGLPYDTLPYFNELLMWTIEEDNPLQSILFYPLMMFNYGKEDPIAKYGSEFSMNPEIYGYEFDKTYAYDWDLKSQKLNYRMCLDIANKFMDLRKPMNNISGFYIPAALSTGVVLEDIYSLTEEQIINKYDIPSMNRQKMSEYKQLVGL